MSKFVLVHYQDYIRETDYFGDITDYCDSSFEITSFETEEKLAGRLFHYLVLRRNSGREEINNLPQINFICQSWEELTNTHLDKTNLQAGIASIIVGRADDGTPNVITDTTSTIFYDRLIKTLDLMLKLKEQEIDAKLKQEAEDRKLAAQKQTEDYQRKQYEYLKKKFEN